MTEKVLKGKRRRWSTWPAWSSAAFFSAAAFALSASNLHGAKGDDADFHALRRQAVGQQFLVESLQPAIEFVDGTPVHRARIVEQQQAGTAGLRIVSKFSSPRDPADAERSMRLVIWPLGCRLTGGADTGYMPMICAATATEHGELRMVPPQRAVLRTELVGIAGVQVRCLV